LVIRHCVEALNVDEVSMIIDAKQIRHAVIVGGHIESMSGLIDPGSHLNLDYPDHTITNCVVVEKFEKGAAARIQSSGFVLAIVKRSEFQHYGKIDYTKRLSEMIEAVKKVRVSGFPGTNYGEEK
jgi:hypothetical protein